jgi:hypothetical protein
MVLPISREEWRAVVQWRREWMEWHRKVTGRLVTTPCPKWWRAS